MIRAALSVCSLYGALGAAAVAATLSGYILVGVVTQLRPSRLRSAPAAAGGKASVPVRALSAPVARKKRSAPGVAAVQEAGQSLRLMLSVIVGPSRAEVFVNTRRLGETPYLGDYSCRRGEALHFEIVPKRGPLIERTAVCQGKSLRIRD